MKQVSNTGLHVIRAIRNGITYAWTPWPSTPESWDDKQFIEYIPESFVAKAKGGNRRMK